MKNNKEYWGKTRRRTLGLIMLVGCMILFGVFELSAESDLKDAQKRVEDKAEYIKTQYITYQKYNASNVTKSLDRLIDKTQQVRRDVARHSKEIDYDLLKKYTGEQRLSGITLMSPSGDVVQEYKTVDIPDAEVRKEIKREVVLNTAQYELKNYAERIETEDGTLVDISAVGRPDQKGVIVCYTVTKAQYAKNYALSIQSLLEGYNMHTNGTIIITKEKKIIASNDKRHVDLNSFDCPFVSKLNRAIRNHKKRSQLMRFQVDHNFYYGNVSGGTDYYIYTCLPLSKVYVNCWRNVLVAAIIYISFSAIILFVQYRGEQVHMRERRQRELVIKAQEAQSANVAKTEFLQRMSHDIRTPINGIRGMIEVANYYNDDLDKQAECRKKIWDASGLLLELVDEVLDMGKLESGEIIMEERSFNLSRMLDNLYQVVEQQAVERGITIQVADYDVKHSSFVGSPIHIKRMFMNILSNAVKYNKDNGKIILSYKEETMDEDHVVLTFRCEDTGIGMSEEFQQKIFEPFAQEHAGSRTKFSGTGLGMSITKKLIEKMGGTITFESELGKGTTFVFRIPFQTDPDVEKREEQKAAAERSIKGLKILLAEDNALNMEIAEFMLQNEGACVCKAWNGQQAAEIFENSRPHEFDAILMDIMMPVMNGYEAAERIRSLDREDAKVVPIIAMTANAFTEDRIRAKEAGMDEHIAKPIDVKLLVKVICKLVGNDFMGSCNEKEKVE